MARPSRPWFRFYVEAIHDRKLRRLKPEHRWLFVACLAAARQSCEPGWLLVGEDDPMGWDDLADFAAMPLRSVEKGTDALMDVGVLGYDVERKAWFVPAWSERQYESDDVTARTRKHRGLERSKDVPGNVPGTPEGTPPDTEAETETETPPTPQLDRIVDAVFDRVLADKQRAGENIFSVDGFRKWWEANELEGCRKRAAWFVKHYDMPTIGHYADATRSPGVPRWAMLRQEEPA